MSVASDFTGMVIPSQPIPGRGFNATLEDLAPNQLVYLELWKPESRKVYFLIREVTEQSLKGFIVGEGMEEEKGISFDRINTIWVRAVEVNVDLFEWMDRRVKEDRMLNERLGRIQRHFAELLE